MLTHVRTHRGTRRGVRLTSVAAAVAAAMAVWVVAVPVLQVDLEVDQWGSDAAMAVTPAHVIATALVAAFAAWGLLAVLERVAGAGASRIWTVTAVVVLIASLGMPATAARTTAAAVALDLMHLAVGAVLITTMPRGTR